MKPEELSIKMRIDYSEVLEAHEAVKRLADAVARVERSLTKLRASASDATRDLTSISGALKVQKKKTRRK